MSTCAWASTLARMQAHTDTAIYRGFRRAMTRLDTSDVWWLVKKFGLPTADIPSTQPPIVNSNSLILCDALTIHYVCVLAHAYMLASLLITRRHPLNIIISYVFCFIGAVNISFLLPNTHVPVRRHAQVCVYTSVGEKNGLKISFHV